MHGTQPKQHETAGTGGEVGLLDLCRMLARHRFRIALCGLAGLVAASAYLWARTPAYEAGVRLRIGQIAAEHNGGALLVDSAEELAARLQAGFGRRVADGVERPRPYLTRALPGRGGAATVELAAQADTPAEAAAFLKRVAEGVLQAHDQVFQRNVAVYAERLARLGQQRAALQQQDEEAAQLVERLKSHDPVQTSIVLLERGRIAGAIAELDAEMPRLAQRLAPPQSRPTELLGEIVEPATPAGPSRALVLAAGAAAGLIGGGLLALVAEFFARACGVRGRQPGGAA